MEFYEIYEKIYFIKIFTLRNKSIGHSSWYKMTWKDIIEVYVWTGTILSKCIEMPEVTGYL